MDKSHPHVWDIEHYEEPPEVTCLRRGCKAKLTMGEVEEMINAHGELLGIAKALADASWDELEFVEQAKAIVEQWRPTEVANRE
jgi:hypothetical protein